MAENRYVPGKCDFNGRKNCAAEITWRITEAGGFSMAAAIWNPSKTDCYIAGQCVDEVAAFFPDDAKVKRMVEVWKEWHHNDMTAGSPAQEAELAKHDKGKQAADYYEWAKETLKAAGLEPDASYIHQGKPYSYGSAWLKREIPAEIIEEIKGW